MPDITTGKHRGLRILNFETHSAASWARRNVDGWQGSPGMGIVGSPGHVDGIERRARAAGLSVGGGENNV